MHIQPVTCLLRKSSSGAYRHQSLKNSYHLLLSSVELAKEHALQKLLQSKPIPLLPPVITATFPSSAPIFFSYNVCLLRGSEPRVSACHIPYATEPPKLERSQAERSEGVDGDCHAVASSASTTSGKSANTQRFLSVRQIIPRNVHDSGVIAFPVPRHFFLS